MRDLLLSKTKRMIIISIMAISAALLAWFGLVAPVVAKTSSYFNTTEPTLLQYGQDAHFTLVAQGLPAPSDISEGGAAESEEAQNDYKTYVLVSAAPADPNTDLAATFSFAKDISDQQALGVDNPHATLQLDADALLDVYPYTNTYDGSTDYYFTLDAEQAIELDVALDEPDAKDNEQSIYIATTQAATLDEAAREIVRLKQDVYNAAPSATTAPQTAESMLTYTWQPANIADDATPAKAPKKAPAKAPANNGSFYGSAGVHVSISGDSDLHTTPGAFTLKVNIASTGAPSGFDGVVLQVPNDENGDFIIDPQDLLRAVLQKLKEYGEGGGDVQAIVRQLGAGNYSYDYENYGHMNTKDHLALLYDGIKNTSYIADRGQLIGDYFKVYFTVESESNVDITSNMLDYSVPGSSSPNNIDTLVGNVGRIYPDKNYSIDPTATNNTLSFYLTDIFTPNGILSTESFTKSNYASWPETSAPDVGGLSTWADKTNDEILAIIESILDGSNEEYGPENLGMYIPLTYARYSQEFGQSGVYPLGDSLKPLSSVLSEPYTGKYSYMNWTYYNGQMPHVEFEYTTPDTPDPVEPDDPIIVKGAPGSFISTGTGAAENFATSKAAYADFLDTYVFGFLSQAPGNIEVSDGDIFFTRTGANTAFEIITWGSGSFNLNKFIDEDGSSYYTSDDLREFISASDLIQGNMELGDLLLGLIYEVANIVSPSAAADVDAFMTTTTKDLLSSDEWPAIKTYLSEHLNDLLIELGVTEGPVTLVWPNGTAFDIEQLAEDYVKAMQDMRYNARNHTSTSAPYEGVEFDVIVYDTFDVAQIDSADVKRQITITTDEQGQVTIPLSTLVTDEDTRNFLEAYTYNLSDLSENNTIGIPIVVKEKIPEGSRIPVGSPRWYTLIYRPGTNYFSFVRYEPLFVLDEYDTSTIRPFAHQIDNGEMSIRNIFDIALEVPNEPIVTDVKVYKYRPFGEILQPLPGARFSLVGTGYNKTLTTGNDGTIVFDSVPVGSYTLTEIEAPEGYAKFGSGVWKLDVSAVQDNNTYDITTTVTLTPYTDDVPPALSTSGVQTFSYTTSYTQPVAPPNNRSLQIRNDPKPVYELPETGGFGSVTYSAAGAILATLSAALFYRYTKRKELNVK